eukprot:7966551-Pyramimonas_sp.AAC.2
MKCLDGVPSFACGETEKTCVVFETQDGRTIVSRNSVRITPALRAHVVDVVINVTRGIAYSNVKNKRTNVLLLDK